MPDGVGLLLPGVARVVLQMLRRVLTARCAVIHIDDRDFNWQGAHHRMLDRLAVKG